MTTRLSRSSLARLLTAAALALVSGEASAQLAGRQLASQAPLIEVARGEQAPRPMPRDEGSGVEKGRSEMRFRVGGAVAHAARPGGQTEGALVLSLIDLDAITFMRERSGRVAMALEGGPTTRGDAYLHQELTVLGGPAVIDDGPHALVPRVGVSLHHRAIEADGGALRARQSGIDLPAAEVVYIFHTRQVFAEVGPVAGLPLVGRFNEGDSVRRTGLKPYVGARAALLTRAWMLQASWTRTSLLERPIDQVEAKACATPGAGSRQYQGFGVCAEAAWGRAVMPTDTGHRTTQVLRGIVALTYSFDGIF